MSEQYDINIRLTEDGGVTLTLTGGGIPQYTSAAREDLGLLLLDAADQIIEQQEQTTPGPAEEDREGPLLADETDEPEWPDAGEGVPVEPLRFVFVCSQCGHDRVRLDSRPQKPEQSMTCCPRCGHLQSEHKIQPVAHASTCFWENCDCVNYTDSRLPSNQTARQS